MQGRYRMKLVLIAALLGLADSRASVNSCPSGKNTTSGQCCKQCPPGEGVVSPCEAKQTVCAPCLDSETFSESFSHTEKCKLCTKCTGLLRMQTPCTDTNDAICTCNYGYYLNRVTQRCEACTKCPEGQGMLYKCESDHDTVCEECTDDTFSDQDNYRDPCIPCTTCDEEDEVLQECTSISDTVCKSNDPIDVSTFSPSPSDPPEVFNPLEDLPPEITTESNSNTTDGHPPERLNPGLNDKLIPIYSSILAAVVVGLVAFIVFKRWNSCKQNKQGANNCTTNTNQTPSPEGEKLHSDSGISVDSQSLQEQQGQTQSQTVVTIDEEPCLLLPLHTRENVEKLLSRGNEGGNSDHMQDSDWCNLAGLLGYEEERIATFQQEEHPVRALLSDWARKDCASIEALCTALRKINREDVAQSLVLSPGGTKPTATSVV
ncbi:nerve growth factor receptor b [Cyprinodon tularosa]|uniref:nerve growth factor receptor b n=1 Tax=Cyprinodon tularosa TaxID=77115 RepID=UPI0018E23311|nr:nerve growth factor receptor b [Cyprinodon tularosa]